MARQRRKLGILGGMGPEATVYFMHEVIRLTPAAVDQDHIDMLVSNHASIPDRTAFLKHESDESPLPKLISDACMLADAGCEVLAIPCNTSHAFYAELDNALGNYVSSEDLQDVELLNIVDEAIAACSAMDARKVGVLATMGTLLTGLYGTYAAEEGMDCVYPDPEMQEGVNSLIYDYMKAGVPAPEDMLSGFCDALHESGCDAVVLGCTELSLAFAALPAEVRERYPYVVDSLEVLAAACVRECLAHEG